MTVERTSFEVDGLKGTYYEDDARPYDDVPEFTVALHGLMCHSGPGSAIDHIAARWATRHSPVMTFDASGSYANSKRLVNEEEVPFSFSQYVEDTQAIIRHGLNMTPVTPSRLNVLAYSFGGTVAIRALGEMFTATPRLIGRIDTKVVLIQTPMLPADHRHFARYPRFKSVVAKRGNQFGDPKEGIVRFGHDFLDDYIELHEGHGTTHALASDIAKQGARVLYVASRGDEVVNQQPILDLKGKSRHVDIEEVNGIPHDTTDPADLHLLTDVALAWATSSTESDASHHLDSADML